MKTGSGDGCTCHPSTRNKTRGQVMYANIFPEQQMSIRGIPNTIHFTFSIQLITSHLEDNQLTIYILSKHLGRLYDNNYQGRD